MWDPLSPHSTSCMSLNPSVSVTMFFVKVSPLFEDVERVDCRKVPDSSLL